MADGALRERPRIETAGRRAEALLRAHAATLGLPPPIGIAHWRPDSNRKHRLRSFATLTAAGRPRLVAKMRTDRQDAKVGREFRILDELARAGAEVTPVGPGDDDGFVMDFVPDDDFADVFRGARAAARVDLVRRAAEKIAGFHAAGGVSAAPRPEAALTAILGPWRPDDLLQRAALARAPAGAMHGDLGPWNIRRAADGGLAVIDWEDFHAQGVPALDLLNALLTLTILVHPDHAVIGGEALHRRTFVEPGEMTSLLREGLRVYASRTGTAAELILALVPAYCVAMLRRFELEGRPTGHLFYAPLLERFRLDDALWLAR